MIICINESFGVGKTTISLKINEKIDNSILYDPKKIGSFLYENMPYKENDFQDYHLWRKINYEILKDLYYSSYDNNKQNLL